MTWEAKFAYILEIWPHAKLAMRSPGDWYVSGISLCVVHANGCGSTICGDGESPQLAVEAWWKGMLTLPRDECMYVDGNSKHGKKYIMWDCTRSTWLLSDTPIMLMEEDA